MTVSLKLAKLFRKITNSEIDAEGNAHVILSPNETLTIIEARRALTAPPVPVEPGWIACSERMPELDTRVLLYFPDYGGHIEDGCIGDEGDGPYHYFFDGDSLRHEPTHWMPLPEAPGKEE
ncbi:DUF551 domain-containing protein [Cronobacter sakazakii]|nr:DUF551 domain-containing protein [Cronobacter sakazakii]